MIRTMLKMFTPACEVPVEYRCNGADIVVKLPSDDCGAYEWKTQCVTVYMGLNFVLPTDEGNVNAFVFSLVDDQIAIVLCGGPGGNKISMEISEIARHHLIETFRNHGEDGVMSLRRNDSIEDDAVARDGTVKICDDEGKLICLINIADEG